MIIILGIIQVIYLMNFTTLINSMSTKVISFKVDNSEVGNIRKKRAILRRPDFEWTFPINYFVSEGVNPITVDVAIRGIEKETCIRFKKLDSLENATGLNFVSNEGCSSFAGRVEIDTYQEVGITEGCNSIGWIQHLILHSLGVLHQENRPDRDKYIQIRWQNIIPSRLFGFEKETRDEVLTYNLRYDYGSLMQSNATAFSRNSYETVVALNINYWRRIGFAKTLSFNDGKLLNFHFCSSKCSVKQVCQTYGYTDPNNCNRCKCPNNYGGLFCQKLEPNSRGCGKKYLIATLKAKYLIVRGKRICHFQLQTFPNSRVRMLLDSANLPKARRCISQSGLEIKYFKDKSVMGATYCGIVYRRNLISKGSHVSIFYKGVSPKNYIKIRYWRV